MGLMNKWLGMGLAALLLLWAPFMYRELASEPPQSSDGEPVRSDGLDDQAADEPMEAPPKSLLAVEPAKAPEAPAAPSEEPPAPEKAEEEKPPEEAPEPSEPAEDSEDNQGTPEPGEPTAISAIGPVPELRKAFEDETRDGFWAGSQESLLRELAAKYEFDVAERDAVQCRRTVCRISLHIDQENPTALLHLFSDAKNDINQAAAMEPGSPSDDISHVFMYVTRKGYEIPGAANK